MNSQKLKNIFEAKAYAGVMQDKYAPSRIFAGSSEPVYPHTPSHMDHTTPSPVISAHITISHSTGKDKHHGSNKRQTYEVAGYVKLPVKERLERMREQGGKKGEKLSMSSVVAALLEKALQQDADLRYGAMLRPVIEAAIKREMHATTDRVSRLALNAFLAAEQTRVLTIHILSLLLGGSSDVLPELIKESQKQAWANLRNLMGEEGGEN
jgi:hypothetical protein